MSLKEWLKGIEYLFIVEPNTHNRYYELMLIIRRDKKPRSRGGLQSNRGNIRKRLISEQSGKCLICGGILNSPTIEHIIPLSQGGTNRQTNLAVSCADCNNSRGSDPLTSIQLARLNEWYGYYNSIEYEHDFVGEYLEKLLYKGFDVN